MSTFDLLWTSSLQISVLVFKCLPTAELVSCCRVNKRWYEIINGSSHIWKNRMIQDGLWFGLDTEAEEEIRIKKRWDVVDILKAKSVAQGDESDVDYGPEYQAYMTKALREEYLLKSSLLGRSHPYKHIYQMRWHQKVNWSNAPKHALSFGSNGLNVVTCIQIDSEKIVCSSDNSSINIYSIADGSLLGSLKGHEAGVWALQFRGSVLVSGSTDRTVRVWSIATMEQTHIFHGHESTVRGLQIVEPVYQSNGKFLPPYPLIVTGSRDKTLRIWKLPLPGSEEHLAKSPNTPAPSVPSQHPLGHLATSPGQNPYHNFKLEGHTQAVRAIKAHGNVCASGSYDGTVRVWDIVEGTCLQVLTGHKSKVYSVDLDHRRDRVASGSMDGTVKVWDLVSGDCISTLSGHSSVVGLLNISPSYIVSACADSTIKVWNANTLGLERTLTAHNSAVTCFQHDDLKIVSGSNETVKLWDIKDGKEMRDLGISRTQGVWCVAFSSRHLVTASNRNNRTELDVIDFGCGGYDDGARDERLDHLYPMG